ncbi:uncharacterized protein LOC124378392 isoform X2 [Silurus meridionalis]|uniref:uncharacterized protein LOC124378392 isoform X2 n=1 Tax=Silurus meridionalis TaxID=175797 RepID=UPI001EEC7351|nr:uncharacterized protein LOC124378392 isoform X2 [Silurus meridionalis]
MTAGLKTVMDHLDKKMNLLLIYTLYMITARVGCKQQTVTGYEGGSVIINFGYNAQYINHTKSCSKLEGQNGQNNNCQEKKCDLEGKYFAVDDTSTKTYSMMIRNLSMEDEGTYTCGVKNQSKVNKYIVRLVIKELAVVSGHYYKESRTVHPGAVVTFNCTYPKNLDGIKSVYKVTSQGIYPITFTNLDHEMYDIHVSVSDRVINVSISNVTVKDEGLYLCGITIMINNYSSYASIFCEMQLHVTDLAGQHTEPASTPSPGSSNIFITVYVIVALLLIIGVVMIFYKRCSRKVKGDSSPVDGGNPVTEENACYAYYEEPKDTLVAAVYAMAQNPQTHPTCLKMSAASSPNTDDFYSMAELPKIEINSYDLPTHPCNYLSTPSNLPINSSDLPTNLSD